MSQEKCPKDEFIELLRTIGPTATSKRLGMSVRAVFLRRANIEAIDGISIKVADGRGEHREGITREVIQYPGRIFAEVDTGCVVVFSDAHFWPDVITPAYRALLKLIEDLDPSIVVCNGDAFDGASISRHPPIGWEKRPSVVDELETCKARLGEIEDLLRKRKKTRRIWGLGNHDARFETRLATVAPEYAKVHGVHLRDHFPAWEPCWSTFINDDVVVKHRFKNGIHARHNNTVNGGKTVVTGHLHNLGVTAFNDYNGIRWGVDTGTTAQPYGPQFEYLEDNPRNWASGFAVLTFHKGRLLWPDVCHVLDDKAASFRGTVFEV